MTAALRHATRFAVMAEPEARDLTVPLSVVMRFPAPLLPPRLLPRERLRAAIFDAAQRFHVVQIHGGAGIGKTTLVRAALDQTADKLIWVDLRDRSAAEASTTIAELVTLLDTLPDPPHIVLDDLNTGVGDARRLERPLSALATAVRFTRGVLVAVGYTPTPPRLANALGLRVEDVIAIPSLDEGEISTLLALRAGRDTAEVAPLARIVWLQTSGHPQLVAARVAALERDGFPDPDPLDVLHTPASIEDVRQEVRRLIGATLSEPAREMLYRLSLIVGPFRRSAALRIAALEPPVTRPGEIIDELSGPWLERPAKDYLRVSPLVRDAGDVTFADPDVIRLHAGIAASLIAERTISIQEFSGAVLHALRGRADWAAAMLFGMFLKAPRLIRAAFAHDLSWVPLVGVGPDTTLPFTSHVSRQMFRLFQWQVAGMAAPRQLQALAAVMEPEFPATATDFSDRLARHMYIAHRLIQVDAPIGPSEFVLKTLELARLTEEIDAQHGEAHISELLAPHVGGHIPGMFALFIIPRISRPEDLNDLIDALDALDVADRAKFLTAFDSEDAQTSLLFARPWLDVLSSARPDHDGFMALLRHAVEAGRRWRHAVWAREASRQLAVVLDESLHRGRDAKRVLDEAIAEWGESPTLSDQRASLAMNRGDYIEALTIWRTLLPVWRPDARRFDIWPVFSARHAGVAAAELGLWTEAEAMFRSARRQARRFPTPAWSIGLEFDAAYCAWQASVQLQNPVEANAARKRAISGFAAGLRCLERLPNRPENVAEYWVYKAAGHLLFSLGRPYTVTTFGVVSEQVTPLSIGLCSRIDPDEHVAQLPPTPIEYAWLGLLWLIDTPAAPRAPLAAPPLRARVLKRMIRAPFGPVRFMAAHAEVSRTAARGPFEDVLDHANRVACEVMIGTLREGLAAHEPDPPTEIVPSPSQAVAEAWVFPALLAALINARVDDIPLLPIAEEWCHRARSYAEAVSDIPDAVISTMQLEVQQLIATLRDGGMDSRRRSIAAVLLLNSPPRFGGM